MIAALKQLLKMLMYFLYIPLFLNYFALHSSFSGTVNKLYMERNQLPWALAIRKTSQNLRSMIAALKHLLKMLMYLVYIPLFRNDFALHSNLSVSVKK